MRFRPLLPLLLPLLSGCLRPSYPSGSVAESVAELCRQDPGLKVQARLTGHTLYVLADLHGLVGTDLGLDQGMLEKLEKVMLNGTRVSLSSDAQIDFLVVEARDPRLKTGFTLLRYIPDIKGLIYMRYSRTDFENRLVLESDTLASEDDPARWHDVSMPEFMARLISSRLQRQLTANPLVGVFLRIESLTGEARGDDLVITLKRTGEARESVDAEPGPSSDRLKRRDDASDLDARGLSILETALVSVAGDVLKTYDDADDVQRIVIEEDDRPVWERTKADLLDEAARSSKTEKE